MKFRNSTKILLALITSASCAATVIATDTNTYLGANLLYSNTQFKLDYGHNLFKKNAMGLGIAAGYKFHKNFGVELGGEFYKTQKNRMNTVRINSTNDAIFGVHLTPGVGDFVSLYTSFKQRHPYLGLTASYPVFNENVNAEILLGLSQSKFKAVATLLDSAAGGAFTLPRETKIIFSKQKMIPMVRLKLESKLTDSFALNTIVSWHKTDSLKMTAKSNPSYTLKPKNSMNFGIGAAWLLSI